MKKLVFTQFIILLGGTIFAWYNFAEEYISWKETGECTVGCSENLTSPFLSACFYGAIFFTLAFVLNLLILKGKQTNKKVD